MSRKIIELWEGNAPLYNGEANPTFEFYPTQNKRGRGTVVICPGGGYWNLAPYEGKNYAEFLNDCGLDAFVLNYRVASTHNKFPSSLLDARRAIRYVRANTEKYGIDPEKIAIMGSSAGGHLAALTSTYKKPIDGEGVDELDKVCPFPNAQILCYPVTNYESHNGSYNNLLGAEHTEEERLALTPNLLVDDTTPPAFIWHTFEDASVAVASTYDYVTRLKEHNIPTELHVYPYGRHGLGLGNLPERGIVPHVQSWAHLLENWLKLFGYIGE